MSRPLTSTGFIWKDGRDPADRRAAVDSPQASSKREEREKSGVKDVVVVQSLNCVELFATPWTAARQASLSFAISQSLLKLKSIELVMPSSHLILCRPLLLPPSISPTIRDFSNESVLRIRSATSSVASLLCCGKLQVLSTFKCFFTFKILLNII